MSRCCEGVEVVGQRYVLARASVSCADCRDVVGAGDRYWRVRLRVDGADVAVAWCDCCQATAAILWGLGCRPRPGMLEAAWQRAWKGGAR